MLVLLPLLAMLCAFCHAPEHAPDQLNEHPEFSRDGLCADARERLRMAATPKLDYYHDLTGFGLVYLWDERAHAWEAVRDVGLCRVCGCRTWKHPQDPAPSCCAMCSREARLLAYTLRHCFFVPLMTPEEAAALEKKLPQARPAWPRGRLTFSDYVVRTTREFENLPGPATGGRRGIRRAQEDA